jgi:hypothetical protein
MTDDADVAYHMRAKYVLQQPIVVEPNLRRTFVRHLKEVGEEDALTMRELKRWKKKHPGH